MPRGSLRPSTERGRCSHSEEPSGEHLRHCASQVSATLPLLPGGALGWQISRRLPSSRDSHSFFPRHLEKMHAESFPTFGARCACAFRAGWSSERGNKKGRAREGREASGAFLCRCMMYRPGCGRSSMIPSSRPKENSSSGPRCSRSGASTNPTTGSSRGRSPRRSRSPSPRGRRHHRSPSGGRPPRRSPSPRRSSRVRSP